LKTSSESGLPRTLKWLAVVALLLGMAVATAVAVALVTDDGGDSRGARAVGASHGPYRGSEPPAEFRLPSFALRDPTGEVVRSRDLRGKVVLVTFLDSQCEDACPVIARQVGLTVDLLTAAERKEVEAIAISTDPAEDTPSSIRHFLASQDATGKVRFLVGEEQKMRTLWKRFRILSSLESGKDDLHSAPVRVYDRRGVWVSTQHPGTDLTPQNLAYDIRLALR
jgi:protein SCO1